jgi:3-deoxy-D-manno-octulosonate 8-phosphate phosphatase (KDO 8-P phosphatase)
MQERNFNPIEEAVLKEIQLVVFDFDGVFTDNCVWTMQDGTEAVRCWRSDGLGISRLKKIGVKIYIISTEKNPVVTKRSEKLKIECLQAVENKAEAIEALCNRLEIDRKYTMFVGNDINDIGAFNFVALPVAVADAYPEIMEHIIFKTSRPGGFGAVREVCDLIYFAKTNY